MNKEQGCYYCGQPLTLPHTCAGTATVPAILSRVHDPSCAAREQELVERLAELDRENKALTIDDAKYAQTTRGQLQTALAAAEARAEERGRRITHLAGEMQTANKQRNDTRAELARARVALELADIVVALYRVNFAAVAVDNYELARAALGEGLS